MAYKRPRAQRSNTRLIPILTFVFSLLILWLVRHAYNIEFAHNTRESSNLEYVYLLSFFILAWTTVLALLDRPVSVNKVQQAKLNRLRVVVIVPVYNEDPLYLKRSISSILVQSRRPQRLVVIDDGSTDADYKEVKLWAMAKAKSSGVRLIWKRTPNGGKRHAQYVGVNLTRNAHIYVTVDSDSILDKEAIKEGLKPFIDPKVKSVAGVVMAANNQKNFLTRFTDLWFVNGQLITRSSLSTMGAVLVNSGGLALYDGKVVRKNLEAYIREKFFNQSVEFSDDSMLTLYALSEGKAVQQASCFAFCAMPENLNHHIRQYTRWMRGSFIRSFWRFKYLPLNNYGYWSHLFGWFQVVLSVMIFIALFVFTPLITGRIIPTLLIIPILVGYGQGLFYLTVKRNDETFKSQMLTYSTALPAALWAFFILRFVRYYAILTCKKTGWGTRESVEVTA